MSYSQQTNFPGEFVLQKVLSCITFEILSALGESQRSGVLDFDLTQPIFWKYLVRFGEIHPWLAGAKLRVIIDLMVRGPRVIPYFHFKKIIIEKGFRTRK